VASPLGLAQNLGWGRWGEPRVVVLALAADAEPFAEERKVSWSEPAGGKHGSYSDRAARHSDIATRHSDVVTRHNDIAEGEGEGEGGGER